MQFSVGDKVVHPHYGPGRVVAVEHRELVEGFEHYCVVEMLMDGSTLYVPIRKMDELGMRPVMSGARLRRVIDTLRDVPRRLSKDFKKRQGRIREKLSTARPLKLAEAVRDLTNRGERSHLTKVDQDLLKRGRELLAAEIAAATDVRILDAHLRIDAAIERDEAEPVASKPEPQPDAVSNSGREKLVQKLLGRIKK